MSRDIKLHGLMNGEPALEISPDASRITTGAIQMFGDNAPTAVAYCGLDAWFEGDDEQVKFWGEVLNRLTT